MYVCVFQAVIFHFVFKMEIKLNKQFEIASLIRKCEWQCRIFEYIPLNGEIDNGIQ